jgi:hypothetical protein
MSNTIPELRTHNEESVHYETASLAAKLADACVCASFLPNVWQTYYERFHGVLSAELTKLVGSQPGT